MVRVRDVGRLGTDGHWSRGEGAMGKCQRDGDGDVDADNSRMGCIH